MTFYVLGLLGLIALAVAAVYTRGRGGTSVPPAAVSQEVNPAPLFTPPPGTPPPGQVWSPEHGHWHNIAPDPSGVPGSAGANLGFRPAPAPPGTPPPGKVWSEEHGHWHDIEPPVPNP